MEKRMPVPPVSLHRMNQEVVFVKKTILKLGKETYGEKKINEAFQEAFAPYFAVEERTSKVQPLRNWNRLRQKLYKVNHSQ